MSTDSFLSKFQLVRQAKNSGHGDKAAEILSKMISRYPHEVLLYWEMGYLLLDGGSTNESLRYFNEAIQLDPNNTAAWGGLGLAYTDLAEWDLAERAFRKRLDISESANQYLFLSDVLNVKGNFLDALQCCKRAIVLRPDHGEAYLNLGLTLQNLKQYDSAAEAFAKAMELDPSDPRSISELGFLKFGQGDAETAEKLLNKACELSENNFAYAYFYLALFLEARGCCDEADVKFRSALEIAKEDDLINREYERFLRGQREGDIPDLPR